MRITADISLYPLAEDFTAGIIDFILRLRGEYDAVTAAIHRCMAHSFAQAGTMVFVVKYVNADLPIGTAPRLAAGPR